MSTTVEKGFSIPSHVFKEYDIRGKAGEELNGSFAYLLGCALAETLRQLGYQDAVIGHDNRLSSPELHRALVAGLSQAAIHVIDIGQVTTPMFYYSLEYFHVPCGVIITASHNPGDENGFKIAIGKTTIYGERIQELRVAMRRIGNSQGVVQSYVWDERYVRRENIEPAYLDMLARKIQLGPRKLKVVLDCGNGTPSSVAPKALARWGCEVIPLYCESDGTFPNHHPDPVVPENLRDLIRTVRETGADIGIALDGDGDRLGVVDEQGNIRWGDQLMILFWREILQKYPGAAAPVEVKCSQALFDEIARLGGRPFFHRTGHSHVKATLKSRRDVPFAGEMSGHLFFNDEFFGFDDGLYAAGRMLRILSNTQQPLSALFADVPQFVATPETRVPCREEDKAAVIAGVRQQFAGKYEVVDVDGVRVQFPDGWGLVRASNTQAVLVMRAEGKDEPALARIKAEMESAIHAVNPALAIPW
ncbi:phosphomannomutase [Alicyclobacillus cellulosilyticus]|uniref:Phosphomannomutase n=1 Tax=Alicyclobacillus cellulosilyticus TaxID=1003997 RepID=A0A917KBU2_9BACL|nr:phosphomannomutase/phosphoglucomutase [Alicyclobacillus cellulosilyticus]GGJ05979.1 phosphomannomutase [Alicyclobacillus cellulosilyticus]